ncbi:hypothetical protein BGZ79_003492, partial [Entomortierella chlamydospora]
LKKRIVKRQLDKSDSEIQIRGDLSSIENYITLNTLAPNPRKIVPMTSSKQPYVGFTERELAGFFYKSGGTFKEKLVELAAKDGVYPIKGLKGRRKRKTGRRGKIKLWSLDTIKTHLLKLEELGFQPKNYTEDGYISRGTVLTDGFGLYLLAFKLKELQCVRYRRLPEDRLPPRITSSVGGTNYFLQEIRHIIRTKEDIEQLWPGVQPSDIKILTIDASQAFVVGAYAHLPEDPGGHYNLVVNQKAVMQPIFHYRRWLEEQKQSKEGVQSKSIADMESSLPPLRGFWSEHCQVLRSVGIREEISTLRAKRRTKGGSGVSERMTLGVLQRSQQQIQEVWLGSRESQASRVSGYCGESVGRRRWEHWSEAGPDQSSFDWCRSWTIQKYWAPFVPPLFFFGLFYPT